MKNLKRPLFIATITLLALSSMVKLADAFIISGEETNTCSDWISNTKNDNESRYRWMVGFVHGIETTMYPDRKASIRGGRITYLGSKEIDTKIDKRAFVDAIDKACKDNPGYPLADGIAELIMQDLNIIPSQSALPQEPYMLEISVCNGRVESFVGNGELVSKGVQMINVQCPSLVFTAERSSGIGRQILKECPLHSRCHVEGYAPGDAGIQILVTARIIK
jgi:hypothetical protein